MEILWDHVGSETRDGFLRIRRKGGQGEELSESSEHTKRVENILKH